MARPRLHDRDGAPSNYCLPAIAVQTVQLQYSRIYVDQVRGVAPESCQK